MWPRAASPVDCSPGAGRAPAAPLPATAAFRPRPQAAAPTPRRDCSIACGTDRWALRHRLAQATALADARHRAEPAAPAAAAAEVGSVDTAGSAPAALRELRQTRPREPGPRGSV